MRALPRALTVHLFELVDLNGAVGEPRNDLQLASECIHNPAQGRNLHVRLLCQRRRCLKNAWAVFDLVLVRQPLS
jgi:hypothetical protein